MKKLSSFALVLVLVLLSALPGAHPGSLRAVSAYAPPPPVGPESSPAPAAGDGTAGDVSHQAPAPDTVLPEVEQARARQTMESVLDKYLAYWGPRYQVAPLEVSVEGEWAHGVAEWRSEARTVNAPIHVLGHRLPDGTWQALMPSEEGLFLQWVDELPQRLVSAEEKSQLRTQAAEGDARQFPQGSPSIPPLALPTPEGQTGESVTASLPSPQPTGTPTARPFQVEQSIGKDPVSTSNLIPMPTPVPQTMVGSIAALISAIDLVPGTVNIDQEAVPALRQALRDANAFLPPVRFHSVSDVRDVGDWYFVSVVGLDALEPDGTWKLDKAIWSGLVLLHDGGGGHWSGTVEGTPQFSHLLEAVPKTVLSTDSKVALDPIQAPASVTSVYRFPWQAGTKMLYGVLGVHNAGFISGWKAVDFLSDGNTGLGHAPNRLLAATSGSISYVCRDGTSVAIRIGDLLYVHLLDNSNLYVGRYFNEGDEIGQLRSGSFSATCGYASQNTGWFHVHWGFADTGSFEAGGWTLSLADGLWRRGSETQGTGSWFLAEGSGADTTDPDGDITSPSEGATISSQTVHLAGWGSDSQSGFNRAHFTAYYGGSWRQVGPDFTSSPFGFDWNMCDAGVPDGSVTIGLDIWDNAGNEANSPRGVRHFTKNYNCSPPPSCSPNADQIALYVDGDYHGQCVVKGIGQYSNPSAIGLPNDSITSVKVGGNVRAILCRDDNYGGGCETFTGDDPNLGDNSIGNDQVSSAKVEQRTSPPAAPALQSPANGARLPQSTNLTFVWSSSSGATEYQAHYEGGPSGAHDSPWMSSTSWNVGTQWCGDYSWRVRARNSAGESAWSGTRTFTIVPNTPGGLAASAASSSQINLSWNDPGGEKDGYNVYYSNGTYIGSTSSTSYQVTGLSCNTGYSFYVKAYRNSYLSDASNSASASTHSCPPADTQPPQVHWIAPVGDTEVYDCRDTIVQLEAQATDNVAVERVHFWRWDAVGSQWLEIGTDYGAPYQVSLDCSILNLGWNQVNVLAYDTSDNGSDSPYIWIHRPEPQPDLQPYTRDGYAYPVVPASIPGTQQANTLISGEPTYFDWYFANTGNAAASGDFHVELWVGGTRYIRYPYTWLSSGWASGFDDWNITIPAAGWQTVRLTTDPDGTIAEYDEGNNTWQQDFYWAPRAPYVDSMEAGINDWTATGLWHQVDEDSDTYGDSHSWSHSWWYGQDDTGNYDTGGSNAGDLTSPPIYIPSAGHYLRFSYLYETETKSADWDVRSVQVAVDSGPFNEVLRLWDDIMNTWHNSPALDLSGLAGHVIQVRFHFDTGDAYFNDYRGWYIDDLEISTTPPPSCADLNEPNNNASQAQSIAYGQTLSADICPNGDYDFYTFTGSAGDKVVVDVDAQVDGSLLDSYVLLLDSNGTTVLAENDDEILGAVTDSHLGYHLPHDGTYYVKVRAWNHPSVGSTDHFYNLRLLSDNTNPSSAQITSPVSDAWLNSTQQTVGVSATDDESGVNRVEFLWHDADWETSDWVWLGADWDGRDGWTWDMDTSGLPEQRGGAFYVWAFDWVGNWTGAASWNLGVDRTPPVVTAATQPVQGDAPFIDFWVTWWDAADNLSGIHSNDVQFRDGAAGVWTDLVADTGDTYTLFVGEDGHTYYFRARARDNAGNEGDYADGDGDVQYSVEVCPVAADSYESDNTAGTARPIALDGTWQAHNVHAAGDEDWVTFQAFPGVTYTLVTTTTGEHADTVLYLYELDGSTLIASDDDGGTGLGSRLAWQPAAGGVYYAMVNHWDEWAYGCTTGYELSISTDDGTAPTGSVRINNNATYAGSMTVALTLSGTDSGTGVAQALLANSSSFSGATWVDYAASLPWTLASGDGSKTVYLKLRDRAGNESAIYSDAIVLDTTAPTGGIVIEGGAEVVTGTQVILTLTADDTNGVTHMRLRNDAGVWSAWGTFAENQAWTLPKLTGLRTVSVQFRDPAGNVSVAYEDTVFLDQPVHYIHLPIVIHNE